MHQGNDSPIRDYEPRPFQELGQRPTHIVRPLTSYHHPKGKLVDKVAVPPIALDRIDFIIQQRDRQNLFEQEMKEQFENGCRSQLHHEQPERSADDPATKKQIQTSKSCTGFFF